MDDVKLDKQDLINMAELAKKEGICLIIEVTIPGQEETEAIINRPSSIDNKLKYYLATYNEQLVHKLNPAIRIVQISADDLEYEIFESCKNVDPANVEGVD